MRHVLKSTLVGAFLFVFSASFVQAQLSVDVPVLRSNSKGVTSAFKAKGNAEFDVVVRLYEDIDADVPYLDTLGDPWAETLHFAVQGKQSLGNSDPLGGDYVLYVPVNGFLSLLIGATEGLPEDLSGLFSYCTTQVVPYKKGVAKTPYAESPTQIIRGLTSADTLDYMSLVNLDDGQGGTVTTIRIEGANLQIVNGTGTTNGAVDGLGNLIVGYNEIGNPGGDDRTGSHNIVTGRQNSFSSYGGLAAGQMNAVSGPWSSVSGGRNNTASGNLSSVSGGYYNTASGQYASVSGGMFTVASGYASSVSAGYDCVASGNYSSVTGGSNNEASGFGSSVSGGYQNMANAYFTSVSGGVHNEAGGNGASVSGGYDNAANGYYSSVSGGGYNSASGYYSSVSGGLGNSASDYYSSVSGGQYNEASGLWSSVSGGEENVASGDSSSISGGTENATEADSSVVSGGRNNTASGFASSVSGGRNNTASGSRSSVSGGHNRSAPSTYNWAAGGLSESN